MSVEFDTPANRIIAQMQPKSQFGIDTSLSDIALLRQLSIQGRLRFFQQSVTNASPLTITPNNGETLFIFRVITSVVGGGTLSIRNDGQVRYTTTTTSTVPIVINFMDSLVGDGVKVFSITVSAGTQDVSLFGWTENTSRIRDVTI